MRKVIFIFLTFLFTVTLLFLSGFNNGKVVFGEDATPSAIPECVNHDPPISTADCPQYLQDKVNQLHDQANTLSGQIAQFNSQILLSQARIADAQATIDKLEQEIGALGTRISYIATSVNNLQVLLKQRIIATYEQSFVSDLEILVSANDVSDFILRAQYLKQVQENDRKILANLQQTKADYASQKDDRETKQAQIEASKKQLEGLQASLNQQKTAKDQLLAETQGSEANYQQLLKQAQEQISGFKSFSSSHGGGVLPAQSSPDGFFYSQRDERWANNHIGNSSDNILDVGCLVSSIAMVMKKHGQNVTPADVASNSGYYFASTAYMLIPWAGGKFSSSWGYNQSAIDSKLAGGEPVIVGLYAGALGQHFVVLKSGSNGNYKIDDPWNGADQNFSDYYSTSQIFQYGFYSG